MLSQDPAANAESLGAEVMRTTTIDELRDALNVAGDLDRTVVVHAETDPSVRVPSYESWWDVPIAEVAEATPVLEARAEYEEHVKRERHYL